MTVRESGEMYLEAILVLAKKSGYVRSIDVSEYLGYSKPSSGRAGISSWKKTARSR